nr:MMS19 nucleotide excision repair protein homolog isoform X2 [Ipomoea batatas]
MTPGGFISIKESAYFPSLHFRRPSLLSRCQQRPSDNFGDPRAAMSSDSSSAETPTQRRRTPMESVFFFGGPSKLVRADWKALRGALVGCLALLRRKFDVGMVTQSQAMAAAQSFLENMQVQSLGQHDRKVYYLNLPSELSISFLQLCFQILECLLNFHPDAVEPLLSYIAMLEVSAFIFL